MPKTVAVMDGLEELAQALRQEGVRVVDVADTETSISAIVYSARVSPTAASGGQRTAGSASSGGGVDDMVLMLNADEMSVAEIVARIKSVW